MDSLAVLFIGFLGGLCAGVVIGVSVTFPIAALILVAVFAFAMLLTLFFESGAVWIGQLIKRRGEDKTDAG